MDGRRGAMKGSLISFITVVKYNRGSKSRSQLYAIGLQYTYLFNPYSS